MSKEQEKIFELIRMYVRTARHIAKHETIYQNCLGDIFYSIKYYTREFSKIS